MDEKQPISRIRTYRGRPYLTMLGVNALRAQVGLPPIKRREGESLEYYEVRLRKERYEFFRDYPQLVEGFFRES